VGYKPRGRPRKNPPTDSEFARWLNAFMKEYGLSQSNVAAALQMRVETVYGWLAGDPVKNEALVKTALIAVYGRAPAKSEPGQSGAGR